MTIFSIDDVTSVFFAVPEHPETSINSLWFGPPDVVGVLCCVTLVIVGGKVSVVIFSSV